MLRGQLRDAARTALWCSTPSIASRLSRNVPSSDQSLPWPEGDRLPGRACPGPSCLKMPRLLPPSAAGPSGRASRGGENRRHRGLRRLLDFGPLAVLRAACRASPTAARLVRLTSSRGVPTQPAAWVEWVPTPALPHRLLVRATYPEFPTCAAQRAS